MSIDQPSTANGLIARVKNILLTPKPEWLVISSESTGLQQLLIGYVLPLAAIGAVAGIIGSMLFLGFLFGAAGLVPVVIGAALNLAFTLLAIFLCGILINALASSFSSTPNQMRSYQLAAYSATPVLIGSWGAIIPFLGWLIALAGAVYSVVVFYQGLGPMMQTPEDKRVLYTIVLAVIAIVAWMVIGWIIAAIALMGAGFGALAIGAAANSSNGSAQSEVTLPGGGAIDLSELERAAKQAEAAYEQGATVSIAPEQLQALLPDTLPGGFTRTAVSSASTGAMGMNTSEARGEYTRGNSRMTLSVVHMGAMSGVAAMGAAVNVQQNSEDANGYTRTNTVDGRLINEEVNRASNTASYSVIFRNGVAVTAEGSGVSGEDARAAVDALGVSRVEQLGT